MLLINSNDPIKILNRDLQEMGDDLLKFVNIYRNYVYTTDEEYFAILATLENVGHLIKQKRYSELFDDNVQIVYDEPIILTLPF